MAPALALSSKRSSPRPWVRRLAESLPVAREGVDPEGVHRMRVALLRLRVWLMLDDRAHGRLDRDLAWLREALARVRDLDVQLAGEPPKLIAARLRRKWLRARKDLLVALDAPRVGRILTELRALPALRASRAERSIARLARRVLRRARHDGGIEELHRLRSAVRRLRFALEWLGEDATKLEALQCALGDACDAAFTRKALRHHHAQRYRDALARKRAQAETRAEKALRDVRPSLEELAQRGS